jgi:hypothetical protein
MPRPTILLATDSGPACADCHSRDGEGLWGYGLGVDGSYGRSMLARCLSCHSTSEIQLPQHDSFPDTIASAKLTHVAWLARCSTPHAVEQVEPIS